MSAIVCGKRSLLQDLPTPPVSKRIRCSSSSQSAHLVDYLRVNFPDMDKQVLERALEECRDDLDLDLAITRLNQLHLGYIERNVGSSSNTSNVALEADISPQSQGSEGMFRDIRRGACKLARTVTDVKKTQQFGLLPLKEKVQQNTQGEAAIAEEASASENLPTNGAEWVELFVREMTSASNMDDARSRASRVLEVLEKSLCARTNAEAANNFHQENNMLREQVEALIQENTILKRAVSIQHERQKEHEGKNQELQHLKELVTQCQEQLKTLEVNNYALTVHLMQAQQSSSTIPGRFHPDVF